MADARFDVLGIGNAIVDILSQCEDTFLVNEQIAKGAMTLIEEDRAEELFEKMGPATTVSGGSAANTAAGVASLGGRAAYIGKIHDDQLGAVFAHDMKALKIHYATPPERHGRPTACCMIFITPDGQRSMNTFLGASTDLGEDSIDETVVRDSLVTYLEGYLFDKPAAKEAFYKASEYAHAHGRKVALTLSDSFCVNRHRADFQKLVAEKVNILFANEAEACALYEKNSLEEVLPLLCKSCEIVAVTRSEKGSLVLKDGVVTHVDAAPVHRVVDTTGAGDLYAAGFLYGYTQGRDMLACGRIASIAAAEVIGHIGPRPQTHLKKLITEI